MSEVEPLAGRTAPGLGRGLTWALVGSGLIGLAAVLYVMVLAIAKPGGSDSLQALATGPMSKLQTFDAGPAVPPTQFADASGRLLDLGAFKGKVVVLNLWATWCAPCRKEMPTLARLQAAYTGKPLAIVAVSMDTAADTAAAKAFLAQYPPLAFYQDVKYDFLTDLKPTPPGFPTTIIFDRRGRERALMGGEADWVSPEAKAVMDRVMGE